MNQIRAIASASLILFVTHVPCTFAQPGDAGVGEQIRMPDGWSGLAARFYATDTDRTKLPPSLALLDPPGVKAAGEPPAALKTRPVFWKSADGRFCTRIDIEPGTSLYGTGEIAGPLLRNGRRTVCWNTDAYGYDETYPSLYQSHPWVLAVRADGSSFGVLADTTWRCEIDLTGSESGGSSAGSIIFRGEGSPYAVYVIEGPHPKDVLTGLGALVGTMPLPPKWAIGYHQCRYSYFPEKRVREIAENFRSRNLPCDVIWFDIDYMDQYKVFTFNTAPDAFPNVKKLNADLGAMGFRRIWMIDPGVKAEPGYFVYDSGTAKDLWVKDAQSRVYRGEVWPGYCTFPDYTIPEARRWWEDLYKDFLAQGIDGVWNDMNEPAVFNVKSKTMPEDNIHRGGRWDYGGELPAGPHLQYHNVYGMLMAKGTFDGIAKARPDVRPFVLTRAGYMGSHRYAATWTGDNSAEWDDLEQSVSMVLNLGLSGAPFTGPDIGGFNGNGDDKLFVRWFGLGTLLPFSRGHTGKGNIDKEPWAFGPEVEATCRLALERRYRLLPYLYTVFEEASRTGLPVARPLFFADPKDPALRTEDDAFTIGDDLLVVGRLTPERDRAVARPPGKWQRIDLCGERDNPDLPELFVREGAIVPIGPIVQHANQPPKKLPSTEGPGSIGAKEHPLTLLIALDADGEASGTIYEDEGEGFAYRAGGYLRTTYRATTLDRGRVRITIDSTEGRMFRPARELRIILLRDGWCFTAAGIDGQPITMDPVKLAPVKIGELRP
ncbi:MAG: TIM-barrel domain-containing protein [Phycisphaerales bacterium]